MNKQHTCTMKKSIIPQREDVTTLTAMPEISNASLYAWNHALECQVFVDEAARAVLPAAASTSATTPKGSKSKAKIERVVWPGKCEFELCDAVRPAVHHRITVEQKGLVGRCLEGCRHCEFYMRMKAEVAADLCPKASRLEIKKNKLVQQFAGLLLAHLKQGEGSPVELYNHVMKCELYAPTVTSETDQLSPLAHCKFRNDTGSCRSSMELLAHRCVANKKQCPLCSQLPPKLRRMTRKRSAMPLPFSLARSLPTSAKRGRKTNAQTLRGNNKNTQHTQSTDEQSMQQDQASGKKKRRSESKPKTIATQPPKLSNYNNDNNNNDNKNNTHINDANAFNSSNISSSSSSSSGSNSSCSDQLSGEVLQLSANDVIDRLFYDMLPNSIDQSIVNPSEMEKLSMSSTRVPNIHAEAAAYMTSGMSIAGDSKLMFGMGGQTEGCNNVDGHMSSSSSNSNGIPDNNYAIRSSNNNVDKNNGSNCNLRNYNAGQTDHSRGVEENVEDRGDDDDLLLLLRRQDSFAFLIADDNNNNNNNNTTGCNTGDNGRIRGELDTAQDKHMAYDMYTQ